MKTAHDSETPAHGKQVITACACIHHQIDGKEKIFLARRAPTKKFLPGVFELPGGHIDFGEDIVTGLTREVREEFNMNLKVGDPFYVFTYTNTIKGSHSIEVIYFASFLQSLQDIRLNPQDHSEYRWIAEDEIHTIITDGKQADDEEMKALKKAFRLLNGTQSLLF